MTKLRVDLLEEPKSVSVRAGKNDSETVTRYCDAYRTGAVMPPIIVFQEAGTERYIVADGHHRLDAARQAGIKEIEVDLREGDETAALEFALSCNAEHGLPRKQPDIKLAYRRLRENPELCDRYRTNRERADLLRVSERTISNLEAEWREEPGGGAQAQQEKAKSKERAEKHGKSQRADSPKKNGQNSQSCESTEPVREVEDEDALNLKDLRTAVGLLGQFPVPPDDAAQKWASEVDVGHAQDARDFLDGFLEGVGQS